MSSRTRVRAIVAVAAVAAAAVAAVVAWAGRGHEGTQVHRLAARVGAPPLEIDPIVADAGEWAALRNAQSLYTKGLRSQAKTAFETIAAQHPGSLPAVIGDAVASWPNGTLMQMRALASEHPESGAVQLELGLVLFWLRHDQEALAAWRKAERLEPDTPAAVRAETLVYAGQMPPNRPLFVPAEAGPADIAALQTPYEQLEALRQRAEKVQTARVWIDYGAALQRALRPLSAQAAFDHAVALAPDDPEALTAAAVARFTKADPSAAIGRLGPLAQRFPNAAVVRFHFGLCLLWLRGFEDRAIDELRLAIAADPGSVWGREAADLVSRLSKSTSTMTTTG